jgi:hypothetical protein
VVYIHRSINGFLITEVTEVNKILDHPGKKFDVEEPYQRLTNTDVLYCQGYSKNMNMNRKRE